MAKRKRKSGGTAVPTGSPPFKSIVIFYERTPCHGWPPIFRSDQDAIAWAVAQGAFADGDSAGRAFASLRRRFPGNSGLWARWLGVVAGRSIDRLNRRTKWSF